MKDSLKDFVDQNKERFDVREPKSNTWSQIESRLGGQSVSLWNSVLVWRAAAILLMGLSISLFISQRGNVYTMRESTQVRNEFVDLELFYGNQILEKKELVSQFQSETGLTEDEVTQNLQKLEAMYQVLKEELVKHPSQDVKDALVLNLLVRIDLLNQQLNKLDKQEAKPESKTISG